MPTPDPDPFEEHVRWAIRVALGIVGSQTAFRERDDAVQEALLGLHLATERFNPAKGKDFKTFAHPRVAGAVRRTLKKARRRRAVEVVFEGEEELYAALEGPGDPWARANQFARAAADAIAEASQMAEAVTRLDGAEDATTLMARLDADELRLLDLRHRQGLPWEEVGAAFGIKVRAAKYRGAQLQQKLTAMLAKRGE